MDTSLEKDLLRYAGLIPREALKELVAFAKFLNTQSAAKVKADSIRYELNQLDAKEAMHLEEEFVDYRKFSTK